MLNFKGKNIAVLGLNPAGVEMIKALNKLGGRVMGLGFRAEQKVRTVQKELAGLGCRLFFEMPPEDALGKFDLVVQTPGGGTYQKLIDKAVKRGIPVLSDLDVVVPFLSGKIIAVTGTNGKSSTVAFLDTLLRKQGFKTLVLGGDFAPCSAALVTKKKYDFCLIEVSSRRLEISQTLHPHIAILLNIFLAHEDRHARGIEGYYEAKAKIFSLQDEKDFLIHEGTGENLKHLFQLKKPRAVRIPFALQGKVPAPGLFFDKGNIVWTSPDDELEIYSLEKCPVRTGPHFLNLMAALAAARLCGVKPEVIQKIIDHYLGMPHRLQWIRTLKKVSFFDDSRATNPGATIWALGSFPKPVIWIAGGSVRADANHESIPQQAKGRVKSIILVGRQRKKLGKILAGMAPISEAEHLEAAVHGAFHQALPLDAVLFSPSCPPDPLDEKSQIGGARFQAIVKALDPMDQLIKRKSVTK